MLAVQLQRLPAGTGFEQQSVPAVAPGAPVTCTRTRREGSASTETATRNPPIRQSWPSVFSSCTACRVTRRLYASTAPSMCGPTRPPWSKTQGA